MQLRHGYLSRHHCLLLCRQSQPELVRPGGQLLQLNVAITLHMGPHLSWQASEEQGFK
jgi:hypothetical protein